MPHYIYNAKSLNGELKKGNMEAKDEHELAKILREQGYLLISADAQGEKSKKKKFSFSIPILNRTSLVDKVMFTRNLQVMIKAGVTLTKALNILSLQTNKEYFSKVILDVRSRIIKGESLSDSLKKHSDVFSDLFSSMIKVGEESGTLEKVLGNLTHQMEREYELKSKIKGAMMYPAVIIFAMLCVGILMLVLVVPKLAQTFDELGVELPLTTKLVVSIGSFLASFWYLIPLVFIFLLFGLRILAKTKNGKLVIDTLILKIPIISSIIRKSNSGYTVRILSSLIDSGVPIVRSLKLVAGSLNNVHYKRAMMDSAEQVQKGSKLADVLKKYDNIYPILVIQMIEVGEETGETSNILKKLADFFEEEVSNATKNLSSIIEPVLMLIIGAAVGFFAVSMIQPIYSMMGSI
ncbi:MAG: type II secretion system F family protein [Patescibacteria group bacterium]